MRLINTNTLQLTGRYVGDDMPPYAILSHTWGLSIDINQGFGKSNPFAHVLERTVTAMAGWTRSASRNVTSTEYTVCES
jgi:hypothetical protein